MPESLEATYQNLHAAQYASVAIFVALVYDHVLTLEKEYTLIWRSRFSLPKLIFLWVSRWSPGNACKYTNAYTITALTGSAAQLNQKSCKDWTLIYLTLQSANAMGIMNIPVAMRVYVLWNRTKWVAVFLLTVGALAETTAAILFLYSAAKGTYFYVQPDNICKATLLRLIAYSWPLVMIFDCLVLALTAAKIWQLRQVEIKIPLMQIMYRDGLLFFMAMVIARVVNITPVSISLQSLGMLGVHFSFTLRVLSFSRLLLNLKDVATHKEWSDATSFMASEAQTLTTFQAAAPNHLVSRGYAYGRSGVQHSTIRVEEYELDSVNY
ncbi:hypothetical protein BDY19DRAFT_954681 [Irpex rosettiformis]|uniref:Uncharacterized protein n=1 Tax=Irpex rosettiformis TaxID=378272 RepID=A0ACB8U053_9APHY|nr:hypothetical protein BDY19DRAFT_954681 [Irpex rosettiformis]